VCPPGEVSSGRVITGRFKTGHLWALQNRPGYKAPAEYPRLLPVRLLKQPTPVEVVLANGTVLRLGSGCDLALVRALVDALGGAPC